MNSKINNEQKIQKTYRVYAKNSYDVFYKVLNRLNHDFHGELGKYNITGIHGRYISDKEFLQNGGQIFGQYFINHIEHNLYIEIYKGQKIFEFMRHNYTFLSI